MNYREKYLLTPNYKMYHNRDTIYHGCAITRFTDQTYEENAEWCRMNGFLRPKCVYNSLLPTPHNMRDIPDLYIIEMNITTKQVVGVGLITNKEYYKKRVKMHSDRKYNYYTYTGKKHMSIEEFTPTEQEKIKGVLDKFLFTGYTHLIRGTGYSRLPYPLVFKTGKGENRVEITYKDDFVTFFKNAFSRHFKKIEIEKIPIINTIKENGDTEQERSGDDLESSQYGQAKAQPEAQQEQHQEGVY